MRTYERLLRMAYVWLRIIEAAEKLFPSKGVIISGG
jgi:hypothetical protein